MTHLLYLDYLDFSEQKDRNSGFELEQQTVAVTVFTKAERGKSEVNQNWNFAQYQ